MQVRGIRDFQIAHDGVGPADFLRGGVQPHFRDRGTVPLEDAHRHHLAHDVASSRLGRVAAGDACDHGRLVLTQLRFRVAEQRAGIEALARRRLWLRQFRGVLIVTGRSMVTAGPTWLSVGIAVVRLLGKGRRRGKQTAEEQAGEAR